MTRRRRRAPRAGSRGPWLALALAAASAPRPAPAEDPRHAWRTIETPHFQLHYHEGEEALARRAAGAAERAHALLVPLLGHAPEGRTQVVLSDDADEANGSAQVFPYDLVRLLATPPESLSELNDYEDWVFSLVAHEYTHILHMDRVEGVPRAVNRVFGRILVPNGVVPPWMTEGLAVLHEGGASRGRNHSAIFDMYARAIFLDGGAGALRLDEVSNQPLDWPLGDLWYLLGGRFMAFLRARVGDAGIADLAGDQAAQVWPYALGSLAERHFQGRSLEALWAEFVASERARWAAQIAEVRRRPPAAPARLTRRGARVLHPRWSPDGRSIVYLDGGLDERAALRRVSAGGDDLGAATNVEGNGTLAARSAREVLFAATDRFREYRSYDDLYLVDLETRRRARVTWGERATDPDVAPGGATAVYVARSGAGEHALRRVRLDGGRPETLFARPGAQLGSPRLSPDGKRIAFELQEGGRRDIAVWEAGAVSRITDDDAIDTGPAWAPDGRRLFFASDRSGIYNLYAWEPSPGRTSTDVSGATGPAWPAAIPTANSIEAPIPSATRTSPAIATPAATPAHAASTTARPPLLPGTLRQVTNVESGAFEPDVSPDGSTLVFVTYSRAGYDLATLPVDPSRWLDPPAAPARPPDPAERYDAAPEYPDRGYRPWQTLAPTYWLPIVGSDGAGTTLGAFTAGGDAVGLHAWALQAQWSLSARDLDYDLAYAGAWMFPELAVGSRRVVSTAPGDTSRVESVWTPLEVSLVFPRSHLDRTQALAVSWRGTSYRGLFQKAPLAPGAPPSYENGFASELGLGVAYGDALRFVRSISPEEGRLLSLSVRFASPALGGDFRYARARASLAQYLRVPGTRHVVLAARLGAGLAAGTLGGRMPFSLGGIPPPTLADLLLGVGSPPDQLRGYPDGALAGTVLLDGNLELRFPLVAPQLGHATWPVWLRRIHGAIFLDAGTAYLPAEDGGPGVGLRGLSSLRFGTGAELRLEVVLGYYLRTDVRLGVARGLGPLLAPWRNGKPAPDPLAETQVYVTVGPSF